MSALRVFEAAARHESFKQAAEELFVTPGAVSQQIRLLEEHVGVELFVRDGRRVVLSDAGKGVGRHPQRSLRENVRGDAADEIGPAEGPRYRFRRAELRRQMADAAAL
ncbi:MAG: LysR family transcriptional regulator [Asticcacaulis sp.]